MQEREARDAVVLPYEHQGQHGQQYQTADWRDYLPPSAGGWQGESVRGGCWRQARDRLRL